MSDVGKAIYLACSALLFIFAATTSIYLYTTLNSHMDISTELVNVYERVEGESINPPQKRKIPWGEVFITVTNMQQMHVSKVIIGNDNVVFKIEDADDFSTEIRSLKNNYINSYNITEYKVSGPADNKVVQYTIESKS